MQINTKGWIGPESGQTKQLVKHVQSPHFDVRPSGSDVDLLVIHNISLPPGKFGGGYVQQLFTGQIDLTEHPWFENLKGLRVSAHFLIERDGHITQFVSCFDRAWHAGESQFETRTRCNDFSIGIELEGTDDEPYTDPQYTSLALLTGALRKAFPLKAVRGHCHIAPIRKTDPGASFDWSRYAYEAHWPAYALP